MDFVSQPKKIEFCLWVLGEQPQSDSASPLESVEKIRLVPGGSLLGVKGHSGLKLSFLSQMSSLHSYYLKRSDPGCHMKTHMINFPI